MSDQDDFTRDVMERAIRRLNVLEYVILGFAAALALLGGALVAWLLGETLDIPFRWGWALASLLLFLVPGAIVYARENLSTGPEPRSADGDRDDMSENRMESADG
ncbi:MAG: hypothetical protein R3223_01190 [Longimicrobiales bacterium]|nr:hypothetical protein [Longimicrobiales bacterium]